MTVLDALGFLAVFILAAFFAGTLRQGADAMNRRAIHTVPMRAVFGHATGDRPSVTVGDVTMPKLRTRTFLAALCTDEPDAEPSVTAKLTLSLN